MSPEDAMQWVKILNIPIMLLVALIVFGFCICNLDKLYQLAGSIQGLCSGISKRARKGTVSNSIKGKVMKASKIMKSLDADVMIKDLKIEWVKEEDAENFIKNNQVIIRLEHKSNPHKNFVTAVTAFVDVGLLPKAKRYVDQDIMKMTTLSVSRNIVLNGDSSALDYFDEYMLQPVLKSSNEFEDLFQQLKVLDGNGMLYQILLNEYSKAARSIYPDPIGDKCFTFETSELLRFLYNIANGTVTDVTDFCFKREYFKIHIFLTANSKTFKYSGSKVYLKHILKSIDDGIETIYLFGLGKKMQIAKQIMEEAQNRDFRIVDIKKHAYRHKNYKDGRSVNGVCYEMSVFKNE